jgi:hypothetical protein
MKRAPAYAFALAVVAAVALFCASLAPPAAAQYFGRNKVQYKSFPFRVLKTQHFDIYFYPEEKDLATQAGRMAERWYARLSREMGYGLSGRQALILYASHPDFEQTNAIAGELDEGTGGVTEAAKRRIVLPLAGPLAETDHVIGHELVHAFQYDLGGQKAGPGGLAEPAIARLPLWFIEGMAEYLSLGPLDPNTAMWMRDAAETGKLPTVRTLNRPRYFPYRYGQAFWAYVAHRWGEGAVARVLKAAGRSGDAEIAITDALGVTPDSLSKDWQRAVREWYAPIASATATAQKSARPLELAGHGGGQLNVSPAVSPDGRRMVFFSEKDLFSIDMYLADVATGKVERKLTHTAVDPHLQSLQFIRSAGAWSADGRRLAFAGVARARPTLNIIDAQNGRKLEEIELPGLGEVLNPTWSPDGARVAFSALVGGATDLFWVDLATRQVQRLTSDLYTDLQPAWSPDGRSIAFVTDRYTTDVDSLTFGDYRLASLDVATLALSPLPAFEHAKNINPQWASDGAHLYFVSDRSGISDVYRLDPASGALDQVTHLRTGVTGITSLSPAIAVARATDRLVFSAFEKNAYNLYAIDSLSTRTAQPPAPPLAGVTPALIPLGNVRVAADSDSVATAPIASALADTAAFKVARYSSRLSLDYIAQPSVSFGAGSAGLMAGGGTAAFWSDMLGNHSLATVLQIDTGGGAVWRNTAVGAFWENRSTRWDWGFGASQYPYVTRDFVTDFGDYNGVPATRERDFRFWEIHRDVLGMVSYPLSRVQRIELSGGFSNIDFAAEVQTRIFDAATGAPLFKSTEGLSTDSLSALNFGTGGAALVYDNSVFGGTSPVLGQRYRLEASGWVGTINYGTFLIDVRRYVPVTRLLTLAGRVLHFGRYGQGGEDRRLQDLYLGYPYLMRGYNDGSFGDSDRMATATNPDSFPVFDRLFGSRLAVANLELRLPLLGARALLPSRGLPPVELAAFADAGAAWTAAGKPRFLGGGRSGVSSYGTALRVNLFGFAVGEIDLVHPNDRPRKGWYWEFSLTPGF